MPLFSVFLLGWLALPAALLQPGFWLSLKLISAFPSLPLLGPWEWLLAGCCHFTRVLQGWMWHPTTSLFVASKGKKERGEPALQPYILALGQPTMSVTAAVTHLPAKSEVIRSFIYVGIHVYLCF